MTNRRNFVKGIAGTTAGLAVGSNLGFVNKERGQDVHEVNGPVDLPNNPLVIFDNFHSSSRGSYSWKAKFMAAKHAGFDGFEFVIIDPRSDKWKEAMDAFSKTDFKTWGFHWSVRSVVDDKASELEADIEKIIENVELLSGMTRKPYFTLSLSGTSELKGPTIKERGSAKAEERHWQRAYKIISAFDKACHDNGVVGSLYPHIDWICDTPQSAFKILEGAKAQTVGPAFCAHHWHANAASDKLDVVLKNDYMRRLSYVVLTNGIFTPSKMTTVRFDEGQMDMAWMLAKLYEFGYQGPISTQGYGIGGDPYTASKQFVDSVRSLRKRFIEYPELNPLTI